MNTVQEIQSEAMSLSASERAGLAHELILSLDDPAHFELGPDQEREIQRRVRLVREGKTASRPAEDIFADIKAKYK